MAGDVYHVVCSMCGDIGFPDKLFRCSKCHNRYQHSYCSNYYSEVAAEPIEICDWCKSDEINNAKQAAGSTSSRKSCAGGGGNRSEYSGGKIKQQQIIKEDQEISPTKNHTTPSPRTRRYKLLKDVTC